MNDKLNRNNMKVRMRIRDEKYIYHKGHWWKKKKNVIDENCSKKLNTLIH